MTVETPSTDLTDPKLSDQLKLLQTLYVILGALCFVGILGCLGAFVMGLILMGMSSEMRSAAGEPMPLQLPLLFIGSGLLGAVFYGISMVCMVKCGRKLGSCQGHRFCKKVAILSCFLYSPLGTALGIYTLLLLGKPEVKSRFH